MTDPRSAGEMQAITRAGPWPICGTLEEYQAATDRAVREACRTGDITYRWNTRYRLWERPMTPELRRNIDRLWHRRQLAISIAEEREYLLRRLCAPAVGGA